VRKALAGLMLLLPLALAQQAQGPQYVTWNDLAIFMAAYSFVQVLLYSLVAVPYAGLLAIVGGIIGGAVAAIIAYIIAKVAIMFIKE